LRASRRWAGGLDHALAARSAAGDAVGEASGATALPMIWH